VKNIVRVTTYHPQLVISSTPDTIIIIITILPIIITTINMVIIISIRLQAHLTVLQPPRQFNLMEVQGLLVAMVVMGIIIIIRYLPHHILTTTPFIHTIIHQQRFRCLQKHNNLQLSSSLPNVEYSLSSKQQLFFQDSVRTMFLRQQMFLPIMGT